MSDERRELQDRLREIGDDPEALELAYQEALAAGEDEAFEAALEALYEEAEDHLLYGAWHYRLLHRAARAARRVIAWRWALPLAALCGALLWWLSDEERAPLTIVHPYLDIESGAGIPLLFLLAAPIAGLLIVVFLAGAGDRRWRWVAAIGAALLGFSAYAYLLYPQVGTGPFQEQYLLLAALDLALLAWAGIGAYALQGRWDREERFAFLLKSLEYAVVAGLFAIFLGLFTSITITLFAAIGRQPSEEVLRLFFAGGAGFVAVLAAALVVAPGVAPSEQSFEEGPSRLVTMLLRVLLPMAILVLGVFLAFIPANFEAPLENREVLISFTIMLFAVLGLLLGATPLGERDLPEAPMTWLRRGLILLAALALAVGLYALIALVSRTLGDRLTPNRLSFMGWCVVNCGILAWLLYRQWRAERETWLPAMQGALSDGIPPYLAWTLFTLLAIPWLFGVDEEAMARMPEPVQQLMFRVPEPILLKCTGSPHVYLLEDGEKRWIEDILTFEAEGFRWSDVSYTSCAAIEQIPEGLPIPEDAGAPPPPVPDESMDPAPDPPPYPRGDEG